MLDYSVPAPLRSIIPAGWRTLPEDLDFNFRTLFARSGGDTDATALAAWFFGSGRLVGADFTAGRIAMPATVSNSFRIPNATYFIYGRQKILNEPSGFLTVIDVPEDPDTYHVYAELNEDGDFIVDPETGYLTERAEDIDRAYLGTITTDGTAVTAVDGTNSDYLQKFQHLAARLTSGGGSGGGDTVDLTAIYARLESLEQRIIALEDNAGGDVVAVPSESESLYLEVLALQGFLIQQFPTLADHIAAAWDIPGSTGNREPLADGPARRTYAGGNATRDFREKSTR